MKCSFWVGLFTALLVVSTCLLGCAHSPRRPSVESPFPEVFFLTQVVRVHQGEDVQMDFIASLSRRGDAFQLAMLDPILMTPLYVARMDQNGITEDKPLPEQAKGLGEMLLGSLAELFGTTSFELVTKPQESEATAEAQIAGHREKLAFQTRRFLFEMPKFSGPTDCAFPSEIQMRAKGGVNLLVFAKTEDVACNIP